SRHHGSIPSPGDALWLIWLPSRYSGRDNPRSWVQVSIGRSIRPDKKIADKNCRMVWLHGRLAMTPEPGALSSADRPPEGLRREYHGRHAPRDGCRESRKPVLVQLEPDRWLRPTRPARKMRLKTQPIMSGNL